MILSCFVGHSVTIYFTMSDKANHTREKTMSENQEFIPDDGEGLEEKVQPLIVFNINEKRIADAAEEFKAVDAYVDHTAAKKAKRVLTKMRTTLADSHKRVKAEALAHCQDVDAEKRKLLALISQIEDPITQQLTDIKEAAEKEEDERLAAITGEIESIQRLSVDRHTLNVDQLNERLARLAEVQMTEKIFQEQLGDAENACTVTESKLRIELANAERRAEDARKQAETEEENRKLREQLDAQKAKDDAAAEEKRQQEATDAAEQRKKDDAEAAKRKAEQDKIDEQQAAAQKVIDQEKKKIADERAEIERKDAEEKAEMDRIASEKEAAEIAALQAPDKDKLDLYASAVEGLIRNKPVLQSDAGNDVLLQATSVLVEVAYDIRKSNKEL